MRKTDKETESLVLQYMQDGFSSREVALILGIGKSTVNDIVARNRPIKNNKPKILFLDIETAPSVAVTFDRWNARFTRQHIIQEGGWLITAAWSWDGEDEVYGVGVTSNDTKTGNDVYVIENLIEVIEEADVIVGHYVKKFDIPVIRARAVINGFSDIKTTQIVDTCEIAKSMKFNTNKLDDLAAYLGLDVQKIPTDIGLWVSCVEGDEQAIQKMLEYNKQDIRLQKAVYNKLRNFDKKSPNLGVITNEFVCPACGSHNVTSTGHNVVRGQSLYPEYFCEDCGKRSRTNKKGNLLINQ
jgi:DNA polymerase elongation subunit (family B)/predicted RNA-binding Zn-ribbon protein involved in translation (DUF1610 family)